MFRRNARSALVAFTLSCVALGAHAADRSRVVNEGGIADQWMLADGVKLALPGYPAEKKETGDSVCVAIGYAINPDGTTGNFTQLKQWTSAQKPSKDYYDLYASSAAAALSQWKFKPRPEVTKPQRTITVATMTFRGKDGMDPAMLAANCKITDLAAELQDARHRTVDQSRLRRDMEQSLRNSQAGNAMIQSPGQSPMPSGRR